MKSSLLTSSGALGLQPLRWNAFSQAATVSYAPLSASFVPVTLIVSAQEGSGYYGVWNYRIGVSAALPGWVQPGVCVYVQASVTVGGKSLTISGQYVVKAIDTASGLYFDVNAPRPNSSSDSVAINQALTSTSLDNGSGNVGSPTVSLNLQCQKAMLSASAGSVIIAPVVKNGGAVDYSITLTPTSGEYEITAQPGSKFDLADWSVIQSGSGTLSVRFL